MKNLTEEQKQRLAEHLAKPKKSSLFIFLGAAYVAVALLLALLKLVGILHWQWWIATAPIWIPIALFLMLFAICMVVFGIIDRRNARKTDRQSKDDRGTFFQGFR